MIALIIFYTYLLQRQFFCLFYYYFFYLFLIFFNFGAWRLSFLAFSFQIGASGASKLAGAHGAPTSVSLLGATIKLGHRLLILSACAIIVCRRLLLFKMVSFQLLLNCSVCSFRQIRFLVRSSLCLICEAPQSYLSETTLSNISRKELLFNSKISGA